MGLSPKRAILVNYYYYYYYYYYHRWETIPLTRSGTCTHPYGRKSVRYLHCRLDSLIKYARIQQFQDYLGGNSAQR